MSEILQQPRASQAAATNITGCTCLWRGGPDLRVSSVIRFPEKATKSQRGCNRSPALAALQSFCTRVVVVAQLLFRAAAPGPVCRCTRHKTLRTSPASIGPQSSLSPPVGSRARSRLSRRAAAAAPSCSPPARAALLVRDERWEPSPRRRCPQHRRRPSAVDPPKSPNGRHSALVPSDRGFSRRRRRSSLAPSSGRRRR